MGRVIRHHRYGRGEVQQTRYGGFELCVRFEDKVMRWVRMDEVREALPTYTARRRVPDHREQKPKDHQFVARRMIEAFRLGVVPFDCLKDFTFGRDKELRAVSRWLASDGQNVMFLVGGYGTGKTHLLHHVYAQALQGGFAVASVEMDPAEAPFHKPKRVYSHLARNLLFLDRATGSAGGFRNLLRRLTREKALTDHVYFRRVAPVDEDELIWEWIEGSQSPPRPRLWNWDFQSYAYLPGLYDFATAANIYCYLLTGLGWAVRNVLGLNGLLLLFDESESVAVTDTTYQWQKGYNFLEALIRIAQNRQEMTQPPSYTGLNYCRKGDGADIPFAYRQPSGLKLMFAVPPSSIPWGIPQCGRSSPQLQLCALSDKVLVKVFDRIATLYASAYPPQGKFGARPRTLRKLSGRARSTRAFVKGSVEALDILRYRRKASR